MAKKSDFKKIYDTQFGWIGEIGGKEFRSFYFITVSQQVCSSQIGVKLSKIEVDEIVSSNGDGQIIHDILSSKYGYIDVE